MRYIMLNVNESVARILTELPEAREFFSIKKLPRNPEHKMASQLSLKNMLRFKRIDEEIFLRELDEFIGEQKQVLHQGAEPGECQLWARIPCVVQLPVQNLLDAFLAENRLPCKYNIALVEFGREWIDDLTGIAKPPVLVGAGIEGMVQNAVVTEEYAAPRAGGLNGDFEAFEDPRGIFRFLTGVPLVFVADTSRLGREAPPRSWESLLFGNYRICYADDGHLLDGVFLAYVYQQFGEEGIAALKERSVCGVHPSQMIKAGAIDQEPSVYILPYIFGTIKIREPGHEMIWPGEGAPIIPVFISRKKDAGENERRVAEFLCGEECGRIFVSQGLFPSSHPGVSNGLPGKLRWLGWDYIYQNDLLRIIARAKALFLGGEG
ncbi:MAG: ABC transporter substrate-binding protein [Treponema sp.]|jgi:hypothetical protein|nr:ABC transporter substrate-binding protein [Treponema sp.]